MDEHLLRGELIPCKVATGGDESTEPWSPAKSIPPETHRTPYSRSNAHTISASVPLCARMSRTRPTVGPYRRIGGKAIGYYRVKPPPGLFDQSELRDDPLAGHVEPRQVRAEVNLLVHRHHACRVHLAATRLSPGDTHR